MLTKLTVSNYQSIADADLELGPFTVIVGANGAGKSALLRALGALCFNETGTDFIRKGARAVGVAVETDDGVRIVWAKDAKGPARYTLMDAEGKGREFTKLGQSVPPEITQVLGIRRIEIDATTLVAPQFHTQGDYGFLLRESAGKAARILARLTKLDVIVSAQVECRRDAQRAKASAKEETESIGRLEETLARVPDVTPVKAALALAHSHLNDVDLAIGRCSDARRWDTARQRALHAAGVVLPSEDSLTTVGDALRVLEQATAALSSYRATQETLDRAYRVDRQMAEEFVAVQQEWAEAVERLDLCEHCPLREGVE